MNLVDRWQAQLKLGEETLVHDGRLLYREILLSVEKVKQVRVEFLSYVDESQILEIDLSPGQVAANDVVAKAFNLCTETAPQVVVVNVEPKRNQRTMYLVNKWVRGGRVDALLGNYGIVVEENEDYLQLNCSAGVGDTDFTNLVVTIAVREATESAWTGPVWVNRAPNHDLWATGDGDLHH